MGPAAVAAAAVPGVMSFLGGERANAANAREARRNRQFQERMRNTQWQAAVEDLRAAGLNPALAYSQGPNASPSGSMAQFEDTLSPAVNSAQAGRQMRAQLKLLTEQAQKTAFEKETAGALAARTRAENKILGLTRTGSGSIAFNLEDPNAPLYRKLMNEIDLIAAQAHSARGAGDQARALSRITGVGADFAETNLGRLVPLLSVLGGGLNRISPLIRALKRR